MPIVPALSKGSLEMPDPDDDTCDGYQSEADNAGNHACKKPARWSPARSLEVL
ncbi:hypothetical protein J2808_001044 [Pseudarthrobacter sulfonivorans]|nr:hypothetical protein [Pseudarthrobacter sulfonivorans]